MKKNEIIVQEYLRAFGAGDIEKALTLVAEDAIWRVDGSPLVPTVGILVGKEHIRQWLNGFPLFFTPVRFVIDVMMSDSEHVMLTGYFRHQTHGRGSSEWEGKRMIDGPFALHFTIRDGKIARYQIFEDSLAISKAFDANAAPQRQTLCLNGVRYAYSDSAGSQADESKPVLLFAHGLFMERHLFKEQVQEFFKSYRCVALDMPGHGESSYDPSGWTLESIAEDVATLIRELRLDPVVFIGHSQGATAGMHLALSHPELLHSLVCINASARAEAIDRHVYWHNLRSTILSGEHAAREVAFTAVQKQVTNKKWRQTHALESARELCAMLTADRLGFALALDAAVLKRKTITAKLGKISVPTMVICGKHDQATIPELSHEITDSIPGSLFICIEDAQHHAPKETPEEVTKHISSFLHNTVA